MGGGHRRPGGELVGALRRRDQDVDAGCCDRDVPAAVGAREQLVVDIGRGDRDHVRVRGGIERRRFRPGIAGRRYQHDTLAVGDLERAFERRIARAGEAHVDDAHAVVDGVFDALEDVEGRAFGAGRLAGEGADRKQVRAGRNAQELAVRGDGAGHAGAMRMRRLVGTGGIELTAEDAFEVGVTGIDLRIDHRDWDIGALDSAVDVGEPQLAQDVLRGVAFRVLGGAGGRVLGERVDEVGRGGGCDPFARQRENRIAHRHIVGVQANDVGAEAAERLEIEDAEAQPCDRRLDHVA